MLHDQMRLVLRAGRAHCDYNDALVATSREALDRSYNLLRLTGHMVDPHELMMRRAVEAPQGPLRSISVADDNGAGAPLGRRDIPRQKDRIAALERLNLGTAKAVELLALLESLQDLHEQHLAWLQAKAEGGT
ncbi:MULTISPECIES: hypothetical protein [unclassified Mesorhizobium]|uniref:hypothetical protein n=1 Tax=unclassified Mesorhizobium TaxID=325217 RepID=UPI002414F806|nr:MULTISPECIES: hypothetical protein [unclassified Mesorhizobium]MDG4854615.1 hypothetical protein [Mesorhizobium sp. WSM4982]MDG4916063.1 hypothetical protein [Mesorhizobium sp. WSM4983]